jgi:hypothetical protein
VDNNAAEAAAPALIADMLMRRDHWIRTLRCAPTTARDGSRIGRDARGALRARRPLWPADAAGSQCPSVDRTRASCSHDGRRHGAETDGAQRLREAHGVLAALRALQALPPEEYTDTQWKALESIVRLAPHAIAELQYVFAMRGQADFVEVGQGALRALGEEESPTDLLLALDYRIRHILVDEFQDTSFTQFDLLAKLTSGWEPSDGRTLFLVGDPMQSIYRFREAEVGLFLRARREGIGTVELATLTLSSNFRSQQGIVDWVNALRARDAAAGGHRSRRGEVRALASRACRGAQACTCTRSSTAMRGRRRGWPRSCAKRSPSRPRRAKPRPSRSSCEAAATCGDHAALREAELEFRAIEIEPLGIARWCRTSSRSRARSRTSATARVARGAARAVVRAHARDLIAASRRRGPRRCGRRCNERARHALAKMAIHGSPRRAR